MAENGDERVADDDQSKVEEESSDPMADLPPIMMASRSSVGASSRALLCWSMSSS